MVKIGIIIPFYGGSLYLNKLLHSIFLDSEEFDLSVFIIDNSMDDERLDQDHVRDQKVFVINAPVGIGFGKACNIGYRKCVEEKMDYLTVMNQDGYFSEGSLRKLVHELKQQNDFSVAVPLLTKYENNRIEAFFTYVYLTPLTELVSDLFAKTLKNYYPIQSLCGACFVLKLAEYKKSPILFDELYYMYYEDEDLYNRLKLMGHQVMIVPAAIFHHYHSHTKDEFQTISALSVKLTSRHIYGLKNTGTSFSNAFLKWGLIEFRNVVEHLLKLNFKHLIIESISIGKTLIKLKRIHKARKAETILSKSNFQTSKLALIDAY